MDDFRTTAVTPENIPDPSGLSYSDFLAQNPAIGYLKVQASQAQQALPLSDLEIYVTQDFQGTRVLFYRGHTDESGLIERIELPAPPKEQSLRPQTAGRGAVYQVYTAHPSFEPRLYNAEIFEVLTAILSVVPRPIRG
jgi:hypothetical protein